MKQPPWNEVAVLIHTAADGDRAIAAESKLNEVVRELADRASDWHRYKITLPDRRVAPFGYEPEDFRELLRLSRFAR